MNTIRLCRDDEVATVLAIINAAANAYRGVIPADRWHDPYMTHTELQREIAAGVEFWGFEHDGALIGVMGIQPVRDVALIRHAYVRPDRQRHGVGAALIEHLLQRSSRPLLVGTWAAATWAIAFYQRHGFELVERERAATLLETYWSIPSRQIETSVVLAQRGAKLNAIMLA
jgi:N-acetylglutamate synthase-like GNAT family acetyltransferase